MLHPMAYHLILALMTLICGTALILAYREQVKNRVLNEKLRAAEEMKKRIELFLKGLGYGGIKANGRIRHND